MASRIGRNRKARSGDAGATLKAMLGADQATRKGFAYLTKHAKGLDTGGLNSNSYRYIQFNCNKSA